MIIEALFSVGGLVHIGGFQRDGTYVFGGSPGIRVLKISPIGKILLGNVIAVSIIQFFHRGRSSVNATVCLEPNARASSVNLFSAGIITRSYGPDLKILIRSWRCFG